jgi:hypothetical protein
MLLSGTIINSKDKSILANMQNIMNPESLFNEVSIIVRDHYECVIKVMLILVDQCYDYFKE